MYVIHYTRFWYCEISSLLLYAGRSLVRKAALHCRKTRRSLGKTRHCWCADIADGKGLPDRRSCVIFCTYVAQNTSHLIFFSSFPYLQTPRNHLTAIPSTTAAAAMAHKDVPQVSFCSRINPGKRDKVSTVLLTRYRTLRECAW